MEENQKQEQLRHGGRLYWMDWKCWNCKYSFTWAHEYGTVANQPICPNCGVRPEQGTKWEKLKSDLPFMKATTWDTRA